MIARAEHDIGVKVSFHCDAIISNILSPISVLIDGKTENQRIDLNPFRTYSHRDRQIRFKTLKSKSKRRLKHQHFNFKRRI